MKVCTDACILGSYTAQFIKREQARTNNILDIGSGTGVLSLMLAQQCRAKIDAVEIDREACEQTNSNFQKSPWQEKLECYNVDIRQFYPPNKYDLIICNPPFYEEDLKSSDKKKNLAKHNSGLALKELIAIVTQLLSQEGYFAILLPFQRIREFRKLLEEMDFYIKIELVIRHSVKHDPFRGVLIFSRKEVDLIKEELIIHEEDSYSAKFICLLKPYYLYL